MRVLKSYQTAGGKEIQVFIDPKTAHCKIQFVPGGELPQELAGLYTSAAMADIAVNAYLLRSADTKAKKEEKVAFTPKED